MISSRLTKWQLPIFFLLAFAITWSAQIPAYTYAHDHGSRLTNEENLLHVVDLLQGELDLVLASYLLLFMFSFGPTLAGIIVTGLFKGRAGLADLFTRTTRVRVAPRWLLIVLLLPVALSVVSLALAFLASGFQSFEFSPLVPFSLFMPLLVYMLIFTGLAEEIGWRGYALPELQRTRSALRSSWILGIAWGLWHIPSNLYIPYLRGELTPVVALTIMLALTFGVVGWTIVLTWIYNNTQSVFWIIVLHGWSNTVQSYLVLSAGSLIAQGIYGFLPWVMALFLLRRYGSRTLTGRQATKPPGWETADNLRRPPAA